MPIINRIADFHPEMTRWRHQIHAHPETAFEEHKTAAFVAERLESFGITVERGIAGTGVIGTLRGSAEGRRAIALRADMDGLHIDEQNAFSHASQERGRMHACGHDGHTAMLLGAAKHLAETRNFAGTIHFIFQPCRGERRRRAGHDRGRTSSKSIRSTPSLACTIGRKCRPGGSRSSPDR